MKHRFASRMGDVQKSFIREILKVTQNPDVISFAGGLPNPHYFPVEQIRAAAAKVLRQHGRNVLQYAPTAGFQPLREFIAHRYAEKFSLAVDPDDILLTNGSQQGLDLIGKILIDPGDVVILESPSYLGGIQAFSLYQPRFVTVPLLADGVDTAALNQRLQETGSKLFYALPNFQNPTGISYSAAKRQEVADVLRQHEVYFIEDDPYNELRFSGPDLPSLGNYGRENSFLLGSFSKIVAPGLRMGWICALPPLMEKVIVAKQAADLHSNYLSQRVIHQYLQDNDLDAHLQTIKLAYKKRRDLMMEMINVVFVPGQPFYVDGGGHNTMRLNFSNADEAEIETGMARLSTALKQLIG